MGYDAEISRVGAMALFDLKGAQGLLAGWTKSTLPPFPSLSNSATTMGNVSLLFIGRDHWLVMAPLSEDSTLEAVLKPTTAPPDLSIVRISDSQTFFSIAGPDADEIMAIASSMDVHPSIFPDDGATWSEAFGLKALIIRQPGGFWLAVEQSFGDMIEDYLARAMS